MFDLFIWLTNWPFHIIGLFTLLETWDCSLWVFKFKMATNRQLAQQVRRNREQNSIQWQVSTIPISLPVLALPQPIGTTLTKRQLGQAMRQFRRRQLMPERLQINPVPPQAQITNLASTNQQLAQQARRTQELQSLQELPIARRPLSPQPIHGNFFSSQLWSLQHFMQFLWSRALDWGKVAWEFTKGA